MKYWLCKRGEIYYSFDSETGQRDSLRTSDKEEAARIIHAKNDAIRQSAVNLTIARAYLVGADPKLVERTWSLVMQEYCSRDASTARQPEAESRETKLTPAQLLFGSVRKILRHELAEPKTEAEVVKLLAVSKSQAKEWLAKLVADGELEKLARPVRYRAAATGEDLV